MSDKKETPERPALELPIQAHLGDQLKKLYGSILSEPIPERLTQLLDQLERAERKERDGLSETSDGGGDK
ncbi:MAG: Anti-sigma factor NepR [Proteobacteria bacterium]|nr:Anti-sigma factor NepR [Pseudomonadota bacterium]